MRIMAVALVTITLLVGSAVGDMGYMDSITASQRDAWGTWATIGIVVTFGLAIHEAWKDRG